MAGPERLGGPLRSDRGRELAERGASAVEYGLFLAAVATVIIVAASSLGAKAVQGLQFLVDTI